MNDQQSPPVPDPQSQSSSQETQPAVAPSSGLSDQEAFLMLAMSMSGKDDGPDAWDRPADSTLEANGWAIDADATIGGDDQPPESVDGEESPVGVHFDESTDVHESSHVADKGGSTTHDALEEIDLRDHEESTAGGRGQSPFLSALADRLRGRGGRVVWGANSSIDETWEVSDDLEDADHGAVYGRVTEIVDLSTVPVPPDRSSVGTGGPGPVPAPRRSLLRPPEVPDLELPPLVFLDTRGDIVPSIRAIEPDQSLSARVVVDWGEFEPAESIPSNRTDRDDADRDDAEPDDANNDLGPIDETAGEIDVSPDDDMSVEDGRDVFEADRFEFDIGAIDEPAGGPVAAATPALPEGGGPVVNVPLSVWQNSDTDVVLDDVGRMFDQYCGPVIAVIASVADERRAVDEALHETFLTAWESMDSFDPDEPRGPWMFTLARRAAFEQVTISRQLGIEPLAYADPSHWEEEVPVDNSWEAWEVRLAVDQLSAPEYDVLRFIHREGLIHPEIAAEMNSTVGAVKSRAYSGSRRLIELLDHVIRPAADTDLNEDQASALTWYLAGVADGSDLDAAEREAVRRVRNQLCSSTAWIMPDPGARDRLLDLVRQVVATPTRSENADIETIPLGDDEPNQIGADFDINGDTGHTDVVAESANDHHDKSVGPSGGDQQSAIPLADPDLTSAQPSMPRTTAPYRTSPVPEAASAQGLPVAGRLDHSGLKPRRPMPRPTAEHRSLPSEADTGPPYRSILVGAGMVLIALAVLTNVFGLLDSGEDTIRAYQLQPTEVDPDATAVVHLIPGETGTWFEFEIGGLDPSGERDYYAVWLQRTADSAAVPLGSFQWEVSGELVRLSGPGRYDDYDLIVITESARDAQASPADTKVLMATID